MSIVPSWLYTILAFSFLFSFVGLWISTLFLLLDGVFLHTINKDTLQAFVTSGIIFVRSYQLLTGE